MHSWQSWHIRDVFVWYLEVGLKDILFEQVLGGAQGLIYRLFFLGPVPSTSPSTFFPEFIDELKHCRRASGTPQTIHFLKAHDVSVPNSDKNSKTGTNTKTNTEINTKTETNKGRS